MNPPAIPGLKQVQNANFSPLTSAQGQRGILIEFLLKPGGETERFAVTVEQAQMIADSLLTLIQQAKARK